MREDDLKKAQSVHGTVEFLLRRMRHKGDLPAFSEHIIEINRKLSSLKALTLSATGDLAKIILKDFSLTNKLLRVVNSAIYGNLAGRVTTVSKAVLLLGFEKVRMIATALMIFEHLQNKSQTMELKEVAMESFLSGIVAMEVAEYTGMERKEEAFICAMLYNLGKLLVICYYPEEYGAIKEQIRQKGIAEDRAAHAILGITFNELGMAVSRSWNFPDMIVRSMETPPSGVIELPRTEGEIMRNVTHFAHDLCVAATSAQEESWGKAVSEIAMRYQKSVPLPAKQMEALFDSATAKIDQFSEIVQLDKQSSAFLKKLAVHCQSDAQAPSDVLPGRRSAPQGAVVELRQPGETSATGIACEQTLIVTNGISEIADVMKGSYSLSDVMYMILETMYRGFEFSRVIFCLRDVNGTKMVGRFGLGEKSEDLCKVFQIQIGPAADIFNIAISQGRGIVIDDAAAPNVIPNIPEWYRTSLAAPAFLVYPLVIKGNCIGLFYADRDRKGALLTEGQRLHMDRLCSMAIDVITQKHG
jgi:HD-like signal output (HDOD) protein